MRKTAVIIGNGLFPKKEYPLYLIARADYIVCCDGGMSVYSRYMKKIGSTRLPDAVVGDMDSLPPAQKNEYKDLVVRISEQDHNDQTKAFNHILERFPDAKDIFFIAATGKREDHTIGNISLLMEYARERDLDSMDINIRMVSDFSVIFPVTDSIDLDCGLGRRISIFSPDNSLTIKSSGLEWSLDNVRFDNWWKATLNRASADRVSLQFSHKSIAIIIME